MGDRVAKIHQETVTQILRNVAIVALDNFGTHPLICTDYVSVLFGIELGRQFRGIDQVTEHDRELTAFSFGGMRSSGWRCDLGRWRCLGSRLLGCQWGLRDGFLGVASPDQH